MNTSSSAQVFTLSPKFITRFILNKLLNDIFMQLYEKTALHDVSRNDSGMMSAGKSACYL